MRKYFYMFSSPKETTKIQSTKKKFYKKKLYHIAQKYNNNSATNKYKTQFLTNICIKKLNTKLKKV